MAGISRCYFSSLVLPFVLKGALATGVGFGAWSVQPELASAQTASEKAGARAAANQGADAFDANDYQTAIKYFKKAESIIHSPFHELYIARSQAKLGQLVEARELYLKIRRENRDNPKQAKAVAAADNELAELEPRIPTLTFELANPDSEGVQVTVNGTAFNTALLGVAQPRDPGSYTIVVEDAEYRLEQQVELAEGSKENLVLDQTKGVPVAGAPLATAEKQGPPEESEDSSAAEDEPATKAKSGQGLRIGAYAAWGVGAAGLGFGTAMTFVANSKAKDANQLCDEIDAREMTSNCAGRTIAEEGEVNDFDKSSRNARTMSYIGFGVGGAAVATGVVLFILSKKAGSKKAAALQHLQPVVGYRYWGIRGSF
ncbi:MAG: hypothetical protein MK135_09190 [Polyangiaceae bacterium]|nr:hypothetical protein [Polyangiaceae bacterium]